MLFYMTSKVFQNNFLTNEKDKDILNTQYVLVTNRIRKRDERKNIITAYSILYPDAHVFSALTDEDLRERYFEQLSKSQAFIATLIKGSIEEGYHIVFMCTKNEGKTKYLQYLSEYIYLEFGYPVYEYKNYSTCASPLLKYNKEKVLKKCNKILKAAKNKHYEREVLSENGRKRIIKDYKNMKKSELRKNLEKRNLYHDGMSKSEMLDMLETFL